MTKHTLILGALGALALSACGQPAEKPAETAAAPGTVTVADAWCRPTPNGAKAGGCYVTLTAGSDDRLVSVSTALAECAQVHELKTEYVFLRLVELRVGIEFTSWCRSGW